MKHTAKRLLCAALALILLLSVQAPVLAAADYIEAVRDGRADNYDITSREELKQILAQRLEERNTESFTVTSPHGLENLVGDGKIWDVVPLIREMMAQLGDYSGTGADYNGLNVWMIESGILQDKLYLYPIYMTTQEEEDILDQHCAAIMEELALEGYSDYEKVRAIYEYVGTHYYYDRSLSVYSAYEGIQKGTMVCQGYSILMHKLLALAGLRSRIITGYAASGEAHSWNIVRLGRQWYNLDVTWDACEKPGEAMGWNYFLKGEINFTDHIRDAAFRSTAFEHKHTMSQADYPVRRTEIRFNDQPLLGLRIQKGKTGLLEAQVNGARDSVTLTSTDPEVVTIAEDGTLTAVGVGECSIFGYTDRKDIIPGMVTVSVVDLTGATDWAEPEVCAFYLRGLLPVSLCSDFQRDITRAEMARCIYPLLQQAGVVSTDKIRTFLDINGHEDELFMACLTGVGVFDGVAYDRFDPDGLVTREQAAKILVRAYELLLGQALDTDGQPVCTDRAYIAYWAMPYVRCAMDQGLLLGNPDGTFAPKSYITLEQVICVLERMAASLEE